MRLEPLACCCCFSSSPVSSPSQLSQGGVHCTGISHVARCLTLLYQLYPPLLFLLSQTPQSVPCYSQLFSCQPNFFFYFPNSCSSSLYCSFPSLQPVFFISCCIWLILFSLPLNHGFCCSLPSRILPLPHLLVYLLSSHTWLHSPSSHPFWCVSPG